MRPMQQSSLLPSDDDTVHRLFFALWPGSPLRQQIRQRVDGLEAAHASAGRALDPARYHLTLQYLGDFQPLRPSVVDAATAAACAVHVPGFDLVLDRAGSFPGSRVWWLGSQHASHELTQLWGSLGTSLARAGVQVKSPPAFSPHVTILRDVRQPIELLPIEPVCWPVHGFALIESCPGRPYAILHEQALDVPPTPVPQ